MLAEHEITYHLVISFIGSGPSTFVVIATVQEVMDTEMSMLDHDNSS
jgi:hypothetical protein